ncbi:hypothetical protein NH8B_0005 [Pseudogulbenkiania sp. NH8B]|nr:hypothetical protein NH8B_0005 [Pseudogulbenkiania sp. NH8B]
MRIGLAKPAPLSDDVQIESFFVEQGIEGLKDRTLPYSVVSDKTAEPVVACERNIVITTIGLDVPEEDSDDHV